MQEGHSRPVNNNRKKIMIIHCNLIQQYQELKLKCTIHLICGGGKGAGAQEKGRREAREERVGSGSSERAGIRKNANFCHLLSVKILSKTRIQNDI